MYQHYKNWIVQYALNPLSIMHILYSYSNFYQKKYPQKCSHWNSATISKFELCSLTDN